MPLLPHSSYRPPLFLRNGHLLTLYPSFMRRIPDGFFTRERISTPDDDFLDLDWARTGSRKIAILSHGLEGHSRRHYMLGMARMLNRHGWDALAWNYRSCSGEPNRQLRMYHNGAIDDLEAVIQHALASGRYDRAALIGFSLGGNLTLVYLGTRSEKIDSRIERAVAFSVPCDLKAGAIELARKRNIFYMRQFLASLHDKIKAKKSLYPKELDDSDYELITDFRGFDDRYTAPLHGFKNAEDYWEKCSSKQFIGGITVPTLIVNALDDPFLADGCYPVEQARKSSVVQLEMPASGGHAGFVEFNRDGSYWSERRALEFLEKTASGERSSRA